MAVDPTGAVYVSGSSNGQASLVKIDPAGTPPVIINSFGIESAIQPPSAFSPFYVAPGELITIVGQNLGPSATVMAKLDSTGQLPFVVGATSVSFGNYSAPIISIQDDLIVCFAPFEIRFYKDIRQGGWTNFELRAGRCFTQRTLRLGDRQSRWKRQLGEPSGAARFGADPVCHRTWPHFSAQPGWRRQRAASTRAGAGVTVYFNDNQIQPQFAAAADGLIAGITQVNIQIPVGTYASNMALQRERTRWRKSTLSK